MTNPDSESEPASPTALGGDLIIPVLACGLAAYYFGSTTELVWEAKATGIVVGSVLVALCVAHFARIGRRIMTGSANLGLGDMFARTEFNKQRFGLIALMALFIVTIQWIGTTLGLFILLIASMWLLGVRSLRTLLSIAAVTAAIVHLLLITLLSSRLPQGVFQPLLSMLTGGV